MPGILVFGECADSQILSITYELTAVARRLSESTGSEVAVSLMGEIEDDVASGAIAHGADKVFILSDDVLHGGELDAQLSAFETVCKYYKPSVVLFGRTMGGRELAPRLAFSLGVGLAQDCLDVYVDPTDNKICAIRPVYGGNAIAKVKFLESDPNVIVIRPKTTEPLLPDDTREGEIDRVNLKLDPSVIKTKVIETVLESSEGIRLEDAKVVVAGGRGLGGPEPFDMLEDLAKVLGGAVGASRAVCDAGWLDHAYQVGLTGKTVTPDLYITVGISGASQHMAGCSSSKHIIAINRDPEANIFKTSSFGVVGDWKSVLPTFIETVRELVDS